MTKRSSIESRPAMVTAFLQRVGPSKAPVIAAALGLERHQVSMALGCAKVRGLVSVSCRGRQAVWSVIVPVEPTVASAQPAAEKSGQVAATREAPVFRPFDAKSARLVGAAFHSSGLPLRGLGSAVRFGGDR